MKLTICAPNHPYLLPILANASMYCAEHGHNFIGMSEKQCIDALYTGKADIALINPLDFALSKAQILIIPTFAVLQNHIQVFPLFIFLTNHHQWKQLD